MAAAVAPNVLINNDEEAPEGLTAMDTIRQCLYWIGFTIEAQRLNVISESMNSFDDIRMLDEDDIVSDYSIPMTEGRTD